MSRRKQSNPKPLNKGDCAETTDEMTTDSRDSKDLSPSELSEDAADHSNEPQANRNHETDVDMAEQPSASAHTNSMNSPPDRLAAAEDDDDDMNRPPSSASVANAPHSPESSQPTTEPMEKKFRIDNADSADDPACGNEPSDSKTNAALVASATPSPPVREPPLEAAATSSSSPTSSLLPKLRLNALLASDPALMPDAKDLKAIHEESQTQQRIAAAQLPPPPPLTKQQDDLEALLSAQAGNLVEPPPTTVLKPAGAPAAAAAEPPRMKVFMCLPCGIGFSSPSTLEAHQAYYCSHRNKDADDDAGGSLAAAITDKTSSLSAAGTGASGGGSLSGNGSGEPANKALKTGKQYACTQCSYSADKKVSLNRHMRMHQTSPALSANAANGAGADENSSQQVDRYCSDCDIRFNNVKTYRAHKLHYCSSRRTDGQLTPKLEVSTTGAAKVSSAGAAISPQARTKTPTPAMVAAAAAAAAAAAMQAQPQAFLALPTNPILIIPYALIRAASLIPGPLTTASSGIPNPESTCFTLDNGSLKPLATALNMGAINANANPAAATAPTATAANAQMPTVEPARQPPMGSSGSESLLTEKNAGRNAESAGTEGTTKRKEGARESAPLDLSLRRSPIVASLQRHRLYSAASFLDAEQQRLEMETLLEAGKENLSLDESGSITPEQIVCAPSLPNSPSMSPSPKRRAISPRSSGAGSTASMSPPAPNVSAASLAAAASASNMLDLPLRSMLPTDLALKLSESNIINPLLAKQNLELALKLSAAAAVAANTSSVGVGGGSMPAELAAAAVAAAAGKSSLLGLPGMPGTATAPSAGGGGGGGGAVQPQIYVKQGVSKCKECNIVFCKYENYLAHKQHYCSSRNQEPTEGDAAKVSSTPPMAAGANTAETTPVAYQQLICAACGIKYTSLDNLRAHQNYYCPKGGGAAGVAAAAAIAAEGGQLPLPKEKCNKCKTMHEIGLPCPPPPALQQSQAAQHIPSASGVNVPTPGANSQNIYKCPVCDAVSLTASDSRKHMETHGTVKAFRCSICRYKGNTLRGMRTHIRMHFDKKVSDLNEEHYMSCILEEDGLEIPSAATLSQEQLAHQIAAVKQQQQHQQQQQHHQQQQLQQAVAAAAAAAAAAGLQQQQPLYNCDLCNYNSSYKGNVLRHMKLVHPHISINSPSISPEAGDLDVAADGVSLSGSLNGDNGFTIKSEPLDHATSVSNYTAPSLALAKLHDNNNSSIRPPSLPPSSASVITTNNNANNEQMPHIKTEPMDIGAEPVPLPTALSSPAIGPPPPALNATPEENAAAAAVAAMNQKYCQTCDISFNYMKTYLAHKQFYCKNKIRRPEANDSPSPNAPNSLLLLQKNKENLQQEAAI